MCVAVIARSHENDFVGICLSWQPGLVIGYSRLQSRRSRGFTIFRKDGTVECDCGKLLEHLAIQLGHYPERRSGAKGTEPEGVEAAEFGEFIPLGPNTR